MIYDRTQETTTTTGTGPVTLSGTAPSGMRTFAAAVAGAYPAPVVYIILDSARGQWECGIGSLTGASTLTRGVKTSSNNNALVSFLAGEKTVFSAAIAASYADFVTLSAPSTEAIGGVNTAHLLMEDGGAAIRVKPADFFRAYGQATTDLAMVTTPADNALLGIYQGEADSTITFATLVAAVASRIGTGGTGTPTDSIAPTVTAASIANATPNQINLTLSEALSGTLPAASVFVPSGSRTCTAVSGTGTALTLTMSTAAAYGEVVTFSYTQPATNPIQDAANNKLASFTGRAVTNNVAAPAGTPVTGLSLTGPSGGVASAQSTDFTVGVTPVGGTMTGPVTVTPSDNGGGGTFSPTSVQLTDAVRTATFKYTPNATAGAKSITLANNASLTNPGALTYTATAAPVVATAVTMTGPTGGNVSVASTNFSVGVSPVGGTITGTIVVTPSDNGGGGTFNPATVSLTTAVPTATFTYTPSATAGARTISATNDGALANPANITYTSVATVSYTVTPNSAGSNIVASISASTRTTDYGTSLRFQHLPNIATSGAWLIAPTPSAARAGWTNSLTPPTDANKITTAQNRSGATSLNGLTPMNHPSTWTVDCDLMTPPGASGPWYFWIWPEGGTPQCKNPSGLMVTA